MRKLNDGNRTTEPGSTIDCSRNSELDGLCVAAALPTAGSTAPQIIRGVVVARPGMTILIHGAAGGVGGMLRRLPQKPWRPRDRHRLSGES